ncbi:hypothetical protein AJ79_05009 [Helicocarpus griseus UAMH5409]|uniref:Major facilitator superfamily (MFS) profile domain-containing protein n=1 Tax=Helicocarpus griseus UAMH5409 TaxID=1447875 RepID=A0A2B7XRQ0_9EURO|nr:hypothetical protein AJ79_05009 [Helicocarpus griseus UAMH5409]
MLSQVDSAVSKDSVRRKLSFNPIGGPSWTHTSVDEEDTEPCRPSEHTISDDGSALIPTEIGGEGLDTLAAFEVSKWKRIAQVSVAVIYCILSAGVVFGYAALKPILIDEGVYRNLCTKEELDRGETLCYNQDLRLNFMFTLAAVVTNISALPVGTILDTFGPRISGGIGSIFIGAGALCLALASLLPFDAYVPGYFLLALGGPFVFISSFQLSNTFPAHSGLILAMLTGAFDSSSSVFLLFRVLHGGIFSLRNLFLIYLIVPTFTLISQILLMPSTSYKTPGELVQQAEDVIAENVADGLEEAVSDIQEREEQLQTRTSQRKDTVSKIQDLLGDQQPRPSTTSQPAKTPNPQPRQPNDIWGVLHMASALRQIRSPYFILMTAFTILQMLRINYFIATINLQYQYLLSSPRLARQLNHIFDILLPTAGLLAIPFIGLILDRTRTLTVLSTLVACSTLIGVLGCIRHSLPAAYANIALFTLYRPFYYASISDYAAKVFGFQTFGKVYGLMICLAGVGNFMQVPLDMLTLRVFGKDPVPVNILLTALVFVAGGMLVVFVGWKGRERMGAVDVVVESGEAGAAINGNGALGRHAPRRVVRDSALDDEENDYGDGREPGERDPLIGAPERENVNGSTRAYESVRDG